MKQLYLFRLDVRWLSITPSMRTKLSIVVAIPNNNERDARNFAIDHIHSPDWWDNYIINEITYIGDLWAAHYNGPVNVTTINDGTVVTQTDMD